MLTALAYEVLRETAETLEAAESVAPGSFPALATAYRAYAMAHPHLYRLTTEHPVDRTSLPPGLEQRAAAPLFRAVGGDQERARAAWAFAHGMVVLELNGRFPPGADLSAAWSAGDRRLRHGPPLTCPPVGPRPTGPAPTGSMVDTADELTGRPREDLRILPRNVRAPQGRVVANGHPG